MMPFLKRVVWLQSTTEMWLLQGCLLPDPEAVLVIQTKALYLDPLSIDYIEHALQTTMFVFLDDCTQQNVS